MKRRPTELADPPFWPSDTNMGVELNDGLERHPSEERNQQIYAPVDAHLNVKLRNEGASSQPTLSLRIKLNTWLRIELKVTEIQDGTLAKYALNFGLSMRPSLCIDPANEWPGIIIASATGISCWRFTLCRLPP